MSYEDIFAETIGIELAGFVVEEFELEEVEYCDSILVEELVEI